MRFACAVLASLACLSVVMGDGYGGSYYGGQNMYYGYGKGGIAPAYNYGGYGGYSGYGKGGGGGGGGYSGYGGYPTLLYPVASPEPADIPLGALGGLYGGGGFGGNGLFDGDGSILLIFGAAIVLMALLSSNSG